MRTLALIAVAATGFAAGVTGLLEQARDAQDRGALDRIASEYSSAAQKSPNDAKAQYEAALAYSYAAEVSTEVKDKNKARDAAESGIKAAEKAVALAGNNGEYHRILGTLCGQIVPTNMLLAMKYGRCALDEVNKAIQLDPKSAEAYVSRGVGYYYLPPSFGGGLNVAIRDFRKAIELDPKSAEAYLWLGVALRKSGKNADARAAFQKSKELNPKRVWAQQQFEKTPAQ